MNLGAGDMVAIASTFLALAIADIVQVTVIGHRAVVKVHHAKLLPSLLQHLQIFWLAEFKYLHSAQDFHH